FDSSGRHFITASNHEPSGQVKVWSWPSCELRATVETGKIWSVAIDPESTRLATGGDDHLVRIWDISRGQQTMTVGRHSACVRCLAFSADGALLASAGDDHILNVWRSRP